MKLKFLLSLLFLFVATAASAHDFEVDGIYYNINGNNVTVASSPYSNKYSGDVIIPETVSYDSVTYAVTAIDNEAFWGCYKMTSITIPNSVISIGNEAFRECSGLQDVTIPGSVTSIGNGAFCWCNRLTSVTIPTNVTSIGINPFWGSSSITSITVENGNPNYDSRDNCNAIIETATNKLITGCLNTVIPDSITVISYFAFSCCNGLTSVNIPNTVTSIQFRAFHGCEDLLSVTLPNSVTFIGELAFNDCWSLETVSIPNSVTTIEDRAFWGCYRLKDVYSYIRNLDKVSIGKSVFESYSGDYPSRRTLHVPRGTADSYQADENWALYFGQIVDDLVPEECPRGDVNYDGEVNIADVNALRDIILQDSGYTPAADVNGDGEVNIADINAVIDLILGSSTPSQPEHEWVDLGLPSGTLWATMNVGANSPEEYGDYFAWGETQPKAIYNESTYRWGCGYFSLTKYCTKSDYGIVDNKTELDLEDDAAWVNWGPKWCMPTTEQQRELMNNCVWTWTTINGVSGRLATGPNGNTLFLPAAGACWNNSTSDVGTSGHYWSCSLYSEIPLNAYSSSFFSGDMDWFLTNDRFFGYSVRAVRVSQD